MKHIELELLILYASGLILVTTEDENANHL